MEKLCSSGLGTAENCRLGRVEYFCKDIIQVVPKYSSHQSTLVDLYVL